MDILLYAIAAALVAAGFLGAVLPLLPGIPLVFAGLWLIAAVDHYRHLGFWWLIVIALTGVIGLLVDLLAGAVAAKRVGASPSAVRGVLLGTLIGFFFGLPGLLLGPFFGAALGELAVGKSVLRSTRVGMSAWSGLVLGTIVKLVVALAMLGESVVAWWWNRSPG